jgi:hypothetical protein
MATASFNSNRVAPNPAGIAPGFAHSLEVTVNTDVSVMKPLSVKTPISGAPKAPAGGWA